MSALRETRFSDVCGTVDELKRILNEEPEAGVHDPGRLVGLVEDCAAMHLRPAEDGAVPLVQFEDGGVIALSAVRWSEAVANFVPASFDPSPRANRYRPDEEPGDA